MGILKKIGKAFNELTGQSSSAKSQFEKQMQLQHDAQTFSKWQMQNAHQTEVTDLQKAGLNPVLSAGGGGASAGVTEGSASTGQGSFDPMALINTLVSARATEKQNEKTEAETKNIEADTEQKRQVIEWTPELNKSLIDMQNAQTGKAKAETIEAFAKTAAIQFENKMAQMDVDKRKREFGKELDIYKQQMELKLMEEGVNKSTSGQTVKAIGKWVNALSPFVEFTGKSTSETPIKTTIHNY